MWFGQTIISFIMLSFNVKTKHFKILKETHRAKRKILNSGELLLSK